MRYLLINMHEVGCFVKLHHPTFEPHFLAQHIAICPHPILLPYLCNACNHHCHFDAYMSTMHHMVWSVAAGVCSSPAFRSKAVDMFKWSISLLVFMARHTHDPFKWSISLVFIMITYQSTVTFLFWWKGWSSAAVLLYTVTIPPQQKYECLSFTYTDRINGYIDI